MDNQDKNLEMRAKIALNAISIEDQQTRNVDWLTNPKCRQKRKVNLGKISFIQNQTSNLKKQYQHMPSMIKRKSYRYKQRISQVLDVSNKKKDLSNCYLNKKLLQKINVHNRESCCSSILLSSLENKTQLKKRFLTQHKDLCQPEQIDVNAYILKNKLLQSEKQLRKNYSVHVMKFLNKFNRDKQNIGKQVQQIKQLLQDKRNKCRKLSRHGYLILKNQSLDSNMPNQRILEPIKQNNRIYNEQKYSHSRSKYCDNSKIDLSNVLSCSNFLKNAYSTLNVNQRNSEKY